MTSDIQTTLNASEWWKGKRLRYNIGLIVSGIVAFILYAIVVFTNTDIIPDADITIFTTLFQGIGYLLAMLLANLCFYLGPVSERIIKPKNIIKYRTRTFRLGFWFSVVLPFSIPSSLLYLCMFNPSYWSGMK